jgi:hypothetical protein
MKVSFCSEVCCLNHPLLPARPGVDVSHTEAFMQRIRRGKRREPPPPMGTLAQLAPDRLTTRQGCSRDIRAPDRGTSALVSIRAYPERDFSLAIPAR